jgi:hypothetical protein
MTRLVKKLGLVLTAVLVCLLGIVLPASSVAADITQPEEFYGDITVNGVAASVGTVIVAKISGVDKGTFTTTEVGKYGGSGTFDLRLVVSGDEADTGKPITFWVNGSQADQTAIYEPGESEELNLIAWVYPLQASDSQITKALNYLRQQQAQQSNGSIGGFSVDAWVVMAIAAAGQNPDSWTAGGNSIVDYLRDNASANLDANKATDWERSILAIVAAGKNPRNFGGINYVATLLALYNGGQIGDNTLLNDDFWGILALAAIGESPTIIEASKDFIINKQNIDGGWGDNVGGSSDADNTAAAVSALIAAGVSPDSQTIFKALNYLKTQQQNNGGFVSEETTNSAVAAWVINAIIDAGQSPVGDEWRRSGKTPIEHLLSLQDTDGFFNYTASVKSQPEWMTAYAVLALMGKSWPKDTTSPTISNLTPSSGASTTSTSPTISASFSDAVSGINTATATIRVDGTNRTSSATVTDSGISYGASGLTIGTHSVTVAVSDKAGNEASRSWSFSVVTSSAGSGGTGGGGGGGGVAGVTPVLDLVTSKGRFIEDVTAKSEDRKVELYIPKNTIGKNRAGGIISSIRIKEEKDPPDPPEESNVVGLVYDLGPDGATFDPPIILTFKYSESKIDADIAEENLVVAYWDKDDDEWVELESTVDPKNNIITAKVSHFTNFTILAHTHPANFTITALMIAPDEIESGEMVTISTLITNTGDLTDTYEVTLKINGSIVEVKEAEVIGGEDEKVVFSVTAEEAGTYKVDVNGLAGSFVVKEKAVSSAPPAPSSPAPISALPPLPPESPEAETPQVTPPAPLPPLPSVEPTNWPLIGGITAGVIVLGLLIFFLVRRLTY